MLFWAKNEIFRFSSIFCDFTIFLNFFKFHFGWFLYFWKISNFDRNRGFFWLFGYWLGYAFLGKNEILRFSSIFPIFRISKTTDFFIFGDFFIFWKFQFLTEARQPVKRRGDGRAFPSDGGVTGEPLNQSVFIRFG